MAESLLDPYAAIRRMQFYQTTPGWAGGVQEVGDGSQFVEAYGPSFGLGTSADDSQAAYDAFRASGFESKYGTPTLSADGNTMTMELQGLGGHKYDTMTGIWTKGPDG